ncbi:hypothetical protein NEOLEDRAFT_575214 [Neolentinus lepideus HHB14362 ss-1]|uniref:F-box domain-containing protein n=1 Tax=Neolentinus lepideus HHB14362 ss-1 TaxID=1314782 RepID=A0A165QX88_9AGAM|nr:hypothetical protein NEOLEDRAFT_575214 [Neolentinus lepideus HHB14362 ss-1]
MHSIKQRRPDVYKASQRRKLSAMAPRLDTLPHSILEECAFRVALSSEWGSLGDLPNLLLTSRRLYATLTYPLCVSLYARLFCALFPVNHFIAPSPSITDVVLAQELVDRLRIIRRVRRCQLDDNYIRIDLWRLYFMLLESDGAIAERLQEIGLPRFLVAFYRSQLYRSATQNHDLPLANDISAIAVWLSWYTMSEEPLHTESVETREEVLTRIRPFTMNCPQMNSSLRTLSAISDAGVTLSGHHAQDLCDVTHFSQRLTLSCPNLSSAAILLTFARKDALVVHTPQHLNIGVSYQGRGPTIQDCYQFQAQSKATSSPSLAFRTQTLSIHGFSGQTVCPDDLRRLFSHRLRNTLYEGSLYALGRMSGSWSGKLLVSPVIPRSSGATAAGLPDFLCQRPFQCNLREYIRYHANLEQSQSQDVWRINDDDIVSWCQDMQRFDVLHRTGSLELHERASGRIERYELVPPAPVGGIDTFQSSQPADVLIAGETDLEHDRAWGAFVFFGRVRLRDGWVILKRQPKRIDDPAQPEFGTWLFEGYVRAGSIFVGRWRPDPTLHPSGGCEGIFRLNKIAQDRLRIQGGIRAVL